MFYFKVTEPKITPSQTLPTSQILLFMEYDLFDEDGNPYKKESSLGGCTVHFSPEGNVEANVRAVLESAMADFKAHLTKEIQEATIRPSPWMESQP